jgi:hypothetical protein
VAHLQVTSELMEAWSCHVLRQQTNIIPSCTMVGQVCWSANLVYSFLIHSSVIIIHLLPSVKRSQLQLTSFDQSKKVTTSLWHLTLRTVVVLYIKIRAKLKVLIILRLTTLNTTSLCLTAVSDISDNSHISARFHLRMKLP